MPLQVPPNALGQFFTFIMISLLVTAFVVTIGYLWASCNTSTPLAIDGFQNINAKTGAVKSREGVPTVPIEGFYAGPAVGAGEPDCMRTSADASALYALLNERPASTEEGPDDLREMRVLLGKLSCLKRDLLGVAKVVEATRFQPFSTAHDLEPVAETAARCFSRTIPARDLSLSLNKWGSRGTFLIKRLCTSEKMDSTVEEKALHLFGRTMADLNDVALGECCNAGKVVIGGQEGPSRVSGFVPSIIQNMKEYTGYY